MEILSGTFLPLPSKLFWSFFPPELSEAFRLSPENSPPELLEIIDEDRYCWPPETTTGYHNETAKNKNNENLFVGNN